MIRPEYDPQQFYHWHSLQTRFRDLDPLNHSNNAVFNTYFEEARISFTRSIPELITSFREGFAFVLVKCTIEYLKPVYYPSELLIGTSILNVGNTSIEGVQGLYESESKKLISVAQTKGVWFNTESKRPSKVPEIQGLEDMMFKQDA